MTRIHVNERYPSGVDSVIQNLLELEKMTQSVVDKRYSATSENVTGQYESAEEENDLNDSGVSENELDGEGFRNTVKLSEVSHDGSLKTYSVKLKKNGDSRIYICKYCSKEFKKPSDLIRHMRIHTKEKPFKVSFSILFYFIGTAQTIIIKTMSLTVYVLISKLLNN